MSIARFAPAFVALNLALIGSAAAAELESPDVQFFRNLAETRNYTLGIPVTPKITPDGKSVIFLRSGPRDPVLRLYELEIASGKERELLTPEQILQSGEEKLSAEEKSRRERQRQSLRGFTAFQLTEDGARVLVTLGGKLYVVARAGGTFAEMPGSGWIAPQLSPDGKFIGAVRGNELFVIDIAGRTERQLTTGATEFLHHGVAEFVAQEELDRFDGFWWSPDSRSLVYQETDNTGVEIRYIADPLHPEEPPAKNFYPRPGTANAKVRLGIIARDGGQTQWIDWDREKFPYVARVDWKRAKATLTVYVLDRVQQHAELLAVDPANGSTKALLREMDPAWLNVYHDQRPVWLEDGAAFLWSSDRSGHLQLELRARDGALLKALTRDEDGFVELVGVVKNTAGTPSVVVSGGPDPKEKQLTAISLADGKRTALSKGSGVHLAVLSDVTSRWLHRRDLMDGSITWDVSEGSGNVLCSLPSVAEQPPNLPNLEFKRVKGEREYEGFVIRPRNFQKGVKYPVLLEVYAGPHYQEVVAQSRKYLVSQWYADHGYIVVGFDGRGTPGRGREWERAIRGNFIDVALNDQVDALKAVGKMVPEMDLSRVGVSGWSFGGFFSAMATIRRPDVFKAGVAGAPVITWENYDTTYTERYLGLPQENPDAYKVSSVLTYAGELQRPLLIIHGATDDNVYFQHSVQLADALYRAGKPFEMLPLLGTHMVSDPMTRLRRDMRVIEFFNRHLTPEKGATDAQIPLR
jgi:dipeptidyl-peptidase 4